MPKRPKPILTRWCRAMNYFANQLKALGLIGEVVSIINCFPGNKHASILCVGQRITDDRLFADLNLTISTGRIHYANRDDPTKYREGYLLPAETFGIKSVGGGPAWVALVGCPVDLDGPAAYPYPRH